MAWIARILSGLQLDNRLRDRLRLLRSIVLTIVVVAATAYLCWHSSPIPFQVWLFFVGLYIIVFEIFLPDLERYLQKRHGKFVFRWP